jgi:hypothetical protein
MIGLAAPPGCAQHEDPRHAEDQRHGRQRHDRQQAAAGLEHPPAHHAPLAARQVLQHQQPEASEAQAQAEQEADQPRREELVDIRRGAGGAGDERDDADDERPLLEAAEAGNVAGRECLH